MQGLNYRPFLWGWEGMGLARPCRNSVISVVWQTEDPFSTLTVNSILCITLISSSSSEEQFGHRALWHWSRVAMATLSDSPTALWERDSTACAVWCPPSLLVS